jgi:ABC-2 type transport system ATP-binding protein
MKVRRAIGFAMQEVGLDDLSSGMDFLVMQGLLYKLGRRESKKRAEELLELVGLTDVAGRRRRDKLSAISSHGRFTGVWLP